MAGGNRSLIVGLALAVSFPACGGSSETRDDAAGNGGRGGTAPNAPNTCPPTLVNYGSGPGILCNDTATGTTCSDTEQFCRCGEDTIEGRPWNCVPTEEGCPSDYPEHEPCGASAVETCEYLTESQRLTCTCTTGTWLCGPSLCLDNYPGNGASCALEPGASCRFFLAATPGDPDNAPNVTCTCGADQRWSCPPR